MAHRGKPKEDEAWQYVTWLRYQEHIPLRTTWDGVIPALAKNGVVTIDGQLAFKAMFENPKFTWKPEKGLFAHFHKQHPRLVDRLRKTAYELHQPGCYVSCWWSDFAGVIWWSYAEADTCLLLRHGHSTNFGEIDRQFRMFPEVRDVRFVQEALPDLQRDSTWVEVFRCRA